MGPNLEQPNREGSQIPLDYRNDEEVLDDARKKKLGELTDREMRLLAVANNQENRENNKGTIDGQRMN